MDFLLLFIKLPREDETGEDGRKRKQDLQRKNVGYIMKKAKREELGRVNDLDRN